MDIDAEEYETMLRQALAYSTNDNQIVRLTEMFKCLETNPDMVSVNDKDLDYIRKLSGF